MKIQVFLGSPLDLWSHLWNADHMTGCTDVASGLGGATATSRETGQAVALALLADTPPAIAAASARPGAVAAVLFAAAEALSGR